MPTAMVTFNGRITLPTQIRRELGLKTGDNVDFVEVGKGRFAIVSGAGSIHDSNLDPNLDPNGWIPKLDFTPAGEEMDETGL